ncbi:hypothetical protein EJB05_19104, partial [Eragrostis curvula]
SSSAERAAAAGRPPPPDGSLTNGHPSHHQLSHDGVARSSPRRRSRASPPSAPGPTPPPGALHAPLAASPAPSLRRPRPPPHHHTPATAPTLVSRQASAPQQLLSRFTPLYLVILFRTDKASPAPLTWVHKWLPEAARPYALLARLDKPIGTWLLAWPCMWSITIAAMPGELPDLKMLALFGCGAVLLRGAGCTVNDLLDRDIDNKVERTKTRPFASGALTPSQGVAFLGFQLLLGLGILLQLNNYSRILGASSLLLVFSYPLMKRFTFWPQAYLGLTFNWGALLGWAAIKESLDPAIILPLYSAGICWTLVYDTIYAHQDKEDDLKVGVKSTALRFGDLTKYWISGFGAACIGSLALSGYNAELAWPYYPFLTAAAAQLAWQISTVDLSNRSDCNRKFVSNKWFGALVFGGILFGRLAS